MNLATFVCAALLSASPPKCVRPNLMLRTEAAPRSAAFDSGAKAFDLATKDWEKRRYAQAARRFMEASAFFAHDGNAEGNWKYAWQNAALAFEAANKVDEGKAAFEAAAAKETNSEHAAALRAAAAKLDASGACP